MNDTIATFEELIVFCDENKLSALPTKPTTIVEFIESVANTNISSVSIRRKIVSIAAIHRKVGRLCAQAQPIKNDRLQAMISATDNNLRGQRDRVLLMIAYDTMRRRSELASLELSDIRETKTVASILLRRSKTDQERLGTWLHVSANTNNQIKKWIFVSKITNGKILRGILGKEKVTNSLTGAQIGRIFKRLANSAEIDEKIVSQISRHLIKVGPVQDLLLTGARLPQIIAKGGCSKVDTVMRHIEKISSESSLLCS